MKKVFGIVICLVFVLSLASHATAKSYSGKKVLFIDSYHEGYDWSDGITRGVQTGFSGTGVELKVVRMDTKRNGSEDFKKQAAASMKKEIEAFKPDVVIAADDNASKYLIVPYFKDTNLPFVFCGVNWDASGYGFPCKNVTGMLEVTDIEGLTKLLREFAKGDRIGFIADDNETNRKEVDNYKKVFNLNVEAVFVKTFDEFKPAYADIQKKVDSLIFYNFAGIKGWKADEAADFVLQNTRVPTGTFQEGPMPYAVIGYLKIPEEQGEWSAQTALKILDGAKPADIPLARNSKGTLMLNAKLAEKSGIQLPFELIQSAAKVIE
jgi:ABC-type uncharacterized transport system substrate-binding protein